MKIAVIGAGAMGCLFGGRLALAGNDVTLVDVNKNLLNVIKKNGIQIDDPVKHTVAHVTACTADEVKTDKELILLFTKTMHSKSALDAARPFIGEDTILMTLQNGLGNIELLEQYTKKENIMAGVTIFPSDVIAPGHVATKEGGHTKIMALSEKKLELSKQIATVFSDADLDTEVSSDVIQDIWEKAAFNIALNSVTAVCRVTCGSVAASPHGKELAEKMIHEVCAVAKADGCEISLEHIHAYVEDCFANHSLHYPSMAQDVIAGRKTEADTLNGAVLEKASKAGISIPYTETLYDLLQIIETNSANF